MIERSPDPHAIFNQTFCARTRAARIARGLSQADVARALCIAHSTYARCEVDRSLPHHLIEQFVTLTGASFDQLFGAEADQCAEIPRSA